MSRAQSSAELFVLAGGFGTRLQSLDLDVPKALAPVLGKPFLAYLIDNYIDQGITDFKFLLHHQAHLVEQYLDEHFPSEFGCGYQTIVEPIPLGTGGAIAHAVKAFSTTDDFLVVNADTWLSAGVSKILAATSPALGLVEMNEPDRYGVVELDGNLVMSFQEKPETRTGPSFINAGLYYLNPELFRDWDGKNFSIEQRILPNLVAKKQLVGINLDSRFLDIGVPEDYFKLVESVYEGKIEL